MDIQFSRKQKRLISNAARLSSKTENDFVKDAALRAAENKQNKSFIEHEIDLFIKSIKPSLWIDIRNLWSEYIKLFSSLYFIIPLLAFFICFIIFLTWLDSLSQKSALTPTQSEIFVLILLTVFCFILFGAIFFGLQLSYFLNNKKKKSHNKSQLFR